MFIAQAFEEMFALYRDFPLKFNIDKILTTNCNCAGSNLTKFPKRSFGDLGIQSDQNLWENAEINQMPWNPINITDQSKICFKQI